MPSCAGRLRSSMAGACSRVRICANCHRLDSPMLDNATPCDCAAERWEPEAHRTECNALVHDVVLYVVRVPKADLTVAGNLSTFFTDRGWRLKRDGNRYYRGKYVCGACRVAEEQALDRVSEYKKLCRTAQGINDQTYAQMIAQTLN